MYFAALLFNIILGTVIAKSADFSKKTQGVTEHHGAGHSFAHKTLPASVMGRKHKTIPKNMTYIDTPDNSMHVPMPAEDTTNRKKPKKTPKRTIQKIIKKGRAKRKFYVKKNAAMTSTGAPITMQDSEEIFSQRIDIPTTQSHTHKKKGKKWNDRTYQIPLHKLSSKKERRTKRSLKRGRDNIFILQDFDEIEFLTKEKGVDVANVHVKNYW